MASEIQKACVKKWLDCQVSLFKAHKKHMRCGDYIQALDHYCHYVGGSLYDTGIHINGVDKIAEILDLPVKVCVFDLEASDYPYEHQIVWDGVVLYGLYRTNKVGEEDE